jgi:hypothetical protein
MYVDSRSGQAYVTGSVNNIQNLTAVTLNAVSSMPDASQFVLYCQPECGV